MSKVKYGIIGFGGIAENRVAKEGFACDKKRFAPLPHAELIAATDVNPARQAAAEALGLKWFASLDAMLADPEIQAVYVATNNTTHAPLAMKALEAGRHVIVEKPISASIADAEALNKLAAAKGLSLTVDHMMVNNAWNLEAKALIANGTLGTVNDSCFHMEFAYGYDPAEAATWRCSKIDEMGGPIGDVASHCFYMAEDILQEKIVRLGAVYYPKLMNIAAEDGAYIKYLMASGRQGSVKVAFSELRGGLGGTLSNLGYEIYGDKAALRSYGAMFQLSGHPDEPIKIRLELDKFDGEPVAIKPTKINNIYQTLIDKHAVSVLEGKLLTGADAIHNLKLCDACHRSAQAGGKFLDVE